MTEQKTLQKKKEKERMPVVKSLKNIFKSCIGKENRITRRQLFIQLFGSPNSYNKHEVWWLWTVMKRGITYLRRNTYYFVVPIREENDWAYFIPKTQEDTKTYHEILTNHIVKTKEMKQRCNRAIELKFWQKVIDEEK